MYHKLYLTLLTNYKYTSKLKYKILADRIKSKADKEIREKMKASLKAEYDFAYEDERDNNNYI